MKYQTLAEIWDQLSLEDREVILAWVKSLRLPTYENIHMGSLPFVSLSLLFTILEIYERVGLLNRSDMPIHFPGALVLNKLRHQQKGGNHESQHSPLQLQNKSGQ